MHFHSLKLQRAETDSELSSESDSDNADRHNNCKHKKVLKVKNVTTNNKSTEGVNPVNKKSIERVNQVNNKPTEGVNPVNNKSTEGWVRLG